MKTLKFRDFNITQAKKYIAEYYHLNFWNMCMNIHLLVLMEHCHEIVVEIRPFNTRKRGFLFKNRLFQSCGDFQILWICYNSDFNLYFRCAIS
jgi:hypothetical protein